MRIVKHGKVYHCVLTIKGSERSFSTGQRTLEEARRVVVAIAAEEIEQVSNLKTIRADLIQRVMATGGSSLPAGEALRKWVEWMQWSKDKQPGTIFRYSQEMEGFLSRHNLADVGVGQIGLDVIASWINTAGTQRSTRTVRKSAANCFFVFCKDKGWVTENPAALAKVWLNDMTQEQKEGRPGIPMTATEIDAVIGAIVPGVESFWFFAVKIAMHTGLRLSDVATLEWSSVQGDTLIVWTDKRDRRVEIPIAAELRDLLAQVRRDDARFVFPDVVRKYEGPKMSRDLSRAFCKICRRAGVMRSFHSLRHTYVSTLAASGMTFEEIAKRTGHVGMEMVERYVHPPEDFGLSMDEQRFRNRHANGSRHPGGGHRRGREAGDDHSQGRGASQG